MNSLISYIQKHFWQLFRYGLVSIGAIFVLVFLNYLFIDIFRMDPRIGYFLAISVAYIYIFFASSMHVFKTKIAGQTIKSFLIYIFVFWMLNNTFFNIIYFLTRWHYLIITGINIAIFFPIRFLTQKYLVFKDF